MTSPRLRWLFDTDHVSLHERGHPHLKQRLENAPPASVAVSVVTAEEMIRGRLALIQRRTAGEKRVHAYMKFLETVQFLGAVRVLPYDLQCERIFQGLQDLGKRIGAQDLKIASTALANDLVLVATSARSRGFCWRTGRVHKRGGGWSFWTIDWRETLPERSASA